MASHHLHDHKCDESVPVQDLVQSLPAFNRIDLVRRSGQRFQIGPVIGPVAHIFLQFLGNLAARIHVVEIAIGLLEKLRQKILREPFLKHVKALEPFAIERNHRVRRPGRGDVRGSKKFSCEQFV